MEQLQRGILLLLACLMVVSPDMIKYQQNQYYVETWVKAQSELFYEGICRGECCVWEEYLEFCDRIGVSSGETHVFFEEYRREFGPNGVEYRKYVPWEDIQQVLVKNGIYKFQSKSEVRLYVGECGYYGLIR